MNKWARLLILVIGVLLLLPGACFSILGIVVGGRDGPGLVGIGVVILVAAGGLLYVALSNRK